MTNIPNQVENQAGDALLLGEIYYLCLSYYLSQKITLETNGQVVAEMKGLIETGEAGRNRIALPEPVIEDIKKEVASASAKRWVSEEKAAGLLTLIDQSFSLKRRN